MQEEFKTGTSTSLNIQENLKIDTSTILSMQELSKKGTMYQFKLKDRPVTRYQHHFEHAKGHDTRYQVPVCATSLQHSSGSYFCPEKSAMFTKCLGP